jgi:hypothetical protein
LTGWIRPGGFLNCARTFARFVVVAQRHVDRHLAVEGRQQPVDLGVIVRQALKAGHVAGDHHARGRLGQHLLQDLLQIAVRIEFATVVVGIGGDVNIGQKRPPTRVCRRLASPAGGAARQA